MRIKYINTFTVIIPALIFLLLPGSVYSATLSSAEIQQHLSEGERYFRDAVEFDRSDPETAREYYLKSILHFERIVAEGGVRNGKLYYNIGNAYFRLGKPGEAILNYKRAALYIPNDSNLKQNLDFARSRRGDKIDKKMRERVFKTLFFVHYDMPTKVRLIIFTVSFAIVWISAVFLLLWRLYGLRLVLVIAAVVSALFLTSLVVEAASYYKTPDGVIIAEEVIARKGDADTYQSSFTEPLHAGTEFGLIESRPGWWHIELDNGARGWIPSSGGELVIH